MPFQSTVNALPGIGLAGDFATANNWQSVPASAGAFVVGAAGLTPGLFAWADSVNRTVSNFGSGLPTGFVPRWNLEQAVITTYLAEFSNTMPSGFEVTLARGGDYLVAVGVGSNPAFIGAKAYANTANGTITFAASGSPPTAGVVTASVAAASTTSVTGAIASGSLATGYGNAVGTLNVSAVGSGTLVSGGTIAGTGVQAGTTILNQINGTTGGIGNYTVSNPTPVASTTITETYGVMTVTAVSSGTVGVGDAISGTGVVAGTTITQLGTGTGGNGTYYVSNPTVVSSTTVTVASGIETKWTCEDLHGGAGAVGTIVTISSQPLG